MGLLPSLRPLLAVLKTVTSFEGECHFPVALCIFLGMRDFIIVVALCLAAAFVADRVWLGGKYTNAVTHEFGLDMSSANRR